MTSEDTNIADILRNITADEGTKKIIKKAEKAAKKGHERILIEVDEADYDYLQEYKYNKRLQITPLVERLLSLGFHLRFYKYEIGFFKDRYLVWLIW